MRIAYLDCFAGISGDMFLGALLDAGVPLGVLEQAVSALGLGASLRVEVVDRSGISARKVHVLEGERLAEEAPTQAHRHTHEQEHGQDAGHVHPHGLAHRDEAEHTHSHEPGHLRAADGEHRHEHPHEHTQPHAHGRSLTRIRELIGAASLAQPVKDFAGHAFELLGAAEAKIHNVPVDEIHFHEVGAVDAIVDIVAASAGLHHLAADGGGPIRWYSSAINVGGGMVQCAHGTFPVPAPATADLLRGMPTYSAHVEKELVTPTGAAILAMIAPEFAPQPAARIEAIGYGAGTRNPKGFPNVLRLSLGVTVGAASAQHPEARSHYAGVGAGEEVMILETALDDASPQLLAYVAEQALAANALDVMLTPVIMKKGRPGTLLTLLANPGDGGALEQLLLRETTTLGVRRRIERRSCLQRQHVAVDTPYGTIRIKIGSLGEETLNATPEYEDCRAAATHHGVPLKLVLQVALAAYTAQTLVASAR